MSRNALTDMDIVLELEATHGICLDTLNGLHTLVLSSNQLKVFFQLIVQFDNLAYIIEHKASTL